MLRTYLVLTLFHSRYLPLISSHPGSIDLCRTQCFWCVDITKILHPFLITDIEQENVFVSFIRWVHCFDISAFEHHDTLSHSSDDESKCVLLLFVAYYAYIGSSAAMYMYNIATFTNVSVFSMSRTAVFSPLWIHTKAESTSIVVVCSFKDCWWI